LRVSTKDLEEIRDMMAKYFVTFPYRLQGEAGRVYLQSETGRDDLTSRDTKQELAYKMWNMMKLLDRINDGELKLK
jgi:hypothetical protein